MFSLFQLLPPSLLYPKVLALQFGKQIRHRWINGWVSNREPRVPWTAPLEQFLWLLNIRPHWYSRTKV
jgi:hypothetical protein